jgi:hypothetical protein
MDRDRNIAMGVITDTYASTTISIRIANDVVEWLNDITSK